MEVLMTITVTVITIAALLIVVAAILFIPAAVLYGCDHLVGMFGDICCFSLRNSQSVVAVAVAANASNSPTHISSSVTFHDHVGLEPNVLGSIPIFAFSVSDGRSECAVCLAEFKNGEKGRLLPRCGHRFHVDCIDVWFVSRSTCPLCRLTVKAEVVELPV